jgi:hypothetical protein
VAKNLGLAAGSLLLSLVAVVMGSKLGIVVLGIDDPSFRYENQIAMWVPDPAIGFVNKPNLASVAWGNVPIRTNERGFRGNRPTATAPTDGVVRIAALGDSVMWGTGVREERAIPGLLARSLHADVINAGVVGYSTLQELRLLQRDVLALGPDVVLVNYCDNDALPTEDPAISPSSSTGPIRVSPRTRSRQSGSCWTPSDPEHPCGRRWPCSRHAGRTGAISSRRYS